jgi:lysyl-tRNA synthetase class 2
MELTLSEQQQIRMDKRQQMIDEGIEPYVIHTDGLTSIEEIRSKYGELEAEAKTGVTVTVVGRMIFKREAGRLCFSVIVDGKHNKLQLMLSEGAIGKDSLKQFKSITDLGDFIEAKGEIVVSRTGELSIFASSWRIASKALRPLPVLHKDLNEHEQVRRRYLDFLTNEDSRKLIENRIKIVDSVRANFRRRDYLEMETPMLQLIHGGAAARPFKTFINAFDTDVYLRIAPELFLKRAVVGGFDRVFEINRNFRNEGADSSHSPEFSMLEAYEAYSDYTKIGELTEDLIRQAAIDITGSAIVTLKDGSSFDFEKPFKKIDFYTSISDAIGTTGTGTGATPGASITPATELEDLLAIAKTAGLEKEAIGGEKAKTVTKGKVAELLFEHFVEPKLYEPTFVLNFPEDNAPLVSPSRDIPGTVEKWDLFIRGIEVGTGYSELTDPVIQRQRFVEQAELASHGDAEAQVMDEDFLEAIEYGLPPMGGMGMGIDRLVMAITGETSIRQTIPFPLVKS